MMMIRMRMMRVVRIMVNIGIIVRLIVTNTTSGLKMKPVQAGAASTGRG